ncbi:MAG: hypothetical protein A3J27_04995 [Candidatus Tectomicrobia bacterium RIFCSPLOWO2_12_FULL_69_37]|nr:MAG: hypothetical protein A3I72_05590 [Candidatus Tectomicrobia bacterium RIFCSPLOWO2_02_FULL_70_19]OGL69559.1 MAG: hypothetical protein A3J27_04995 [Candidatus Tectomicrobia bacterium RIFCSPLOWO2_12_FULL_69_37]
MARNLWVLVAAVLLGVPAAAGAQAVVSLRSISQNAAREAATVALETCRKNGYNVTVTVLNRTGRTVVVLHDDLANPHTVENSLRKAYTSLTFRVPSGEWGKRITARPTATGALHLDKVTTLEGALPIMAGKEVVGAIGISGAPGGEKDAVCAQAGIDKIAGGLK